MRTKILVIFIMFAVLLVGCNKVTEYEQVEAPTITGEKKFNT